MLITYTGRPFDFNNITKDSIHIPDVLHSLPRLNRFIGHSSRPYSVGEHTYLGLVMAEKLGYTPMQKFNWFIHDFTEAYMGDCPTPLKKMLPLFSEYEKRVEVAIRIHLGLKAMTKEEELLVKRIDNTMLVLEMRDLTLHNYENFINELTYAKPLFDEDFKIGGKPYDDRELTKILESLYNNLVEELKNV